MLKGWCISGRRIGTKPCTSAFRERTEQGLLLEQLRNQVQSKHGKAKRGRSTAHEHAVAGVFDTFTQKRRVRVGGQEDELAAHTTNTQQ